MIRPSRTQASALAVSLAAIGSWIALEGGIQTEAYIPVPGDVPTIGAGHTEGVSLGDRITVERGYELAREDATDAARAVKRCANVPMYQHEFDAYSLLAGNIGGGRFCASSIPDKLVMGNYAAACRTILEFTCGPATEAKRAKPGEKCYKKDRPLKVMKGLKNRRETEYQLCITDPDPAPLPDAGAVALSGPGT